MALSAAAISGLIAGGISLASTATSGIATGRLNKKNREWQEKMHGIQREEALADIASQRAYQTQLISDERAYNSPEAQVERLRDAGLNPSLAYGQGIESGNYNIGSPDVASPAGTPVSSGNIAPDFSAFGNLQAVVPALMNAEANQRNAATAEFRAEFEHNLSQAQVLKYLSERHYIDEKTYGEMLENMYRESTNGKRAELLENQVEEAAQRIEETKQSIAESLSRVGVNDAKISEINAQVGYVTKMTENLGLVAEQIKADTFKSWQSGKTESFKQNNFVSDTLLKQASTELTNSRKALTDVEKQIKSLGIPEAECNRILAPARSLLSTVGTIFSGSVSYRK